MVTSIEVKTSNIGAIVEPMQIEVHAVSASVLSMRNEVHCLVQVGKSFFLTQHGPKTLPSMRASR